MTYEYAGTGAGPDPGAGRLLPGSIALPVLASSMGLSLPAIFWEPLFPLPDVVMRFPAGIAGWRFTPRHGQPQILEQGRRKL